MGGSSGSKSSSKQTTTTYSPTSVNDIGLTGANFVDAIAGFLGAGSNIVNSGNATASNAVQAGVYQTGQVSDALQYLNYTNTTRDISLAEIAANQASYGQMLNATNQLEIQNILSRADAFKSGQYVASDLQKSAQSAALQGQQNTLTAGLMNNLLTIVNNLGLRETSNAQSNSQLTGGFLTAANNMSVTNAQLADSAMANQTGLLTELARQQSQATGATVLAQSTAFEALSTNLATGVATLANSNTKNTLATLNLLDNISKRSIENESADNVMIQSDNSKTMMMIAIVATIGVIALAK